MVNSSGKTNVKPVNDLLARKFSILVEINTAVSGSLDLKESLANALQILQKTYRIRRGVVYLTDEEGKNLNVGASVGFDAKEVPVAITMGEGLPGKAVHTGKAVIVEQIRQEPMMAVPVSNQKYKSDREWSAFAIPILLESTTLGVLLVYLKYQANRDYDTVRKFLILVASALLQQIRLRNEIEFERQRLQNENVVLKHKLQEEHQLRNIVGNSHAMREVYEMVLQVANSDTTVLLRGESGTGKELIAQAIHYNSPRKDAPFIGVNCAAIPENLVESEFFGYEKGAFTGAVGRKKGRFELADTGSIFLDEIGDLGIHTQVKLLRVIQERQFERIGGTETIKTTARLITATNADLEKMMREGRFREDLYYRLNVFSILIPPLRERKTDILLLADHFMLKYARKLGKAIRRISTPAIDMLMRYHWPGNVRELENCIERAVLICQDQVIHSYHLPPTLQTAESSNTVPNLTMQQAVDAFEKELIQDALKSSKGNQVKAARLLNTTERIMGYKIKKHGISINRFK
ncbi:MAG: AAA family ATPase [Calditrichales bacterium]|nr:MAG: AAA family ATPase [Calditrichales bacterium]